jgi:ubiquitin C-terminal hydrolase
VFSKSYAGQGEERGRSEASSQYNLYAIIHHIGALSAGHYVASIKSEHDDKWYCFNDSRVRAEASLTSSS